MEKLLEQIQKSKLKRNIISILKQTDISLPEFLNLLNESYRTGDSLVEDWKYDIIQDFINSDYNEHKVGYELNDKDERKEKLPIVMPSLAKVKSLFDVQKWIKNQKIPNDTMFCITPKYDGLALLADTDTLNAWTRGDKDFGRNSTEHLKLINKSNKLNSETDIYLIGECIIGKENFNKFIQFRIDTGKEIPSNPRNSVSGLLNDDIPSAGLNFADFLIFGVESKYNQAMDKHTQLTIANRMNTYSVPYELVKSDQIDEEFLNNLYQNWSQDYEIDGLVIEVNDASLRNKIGRHKSTQNPKYAMAYKGNFETIKTTKIETISRNVGKTGNISYVGNFQSINLDGADVKNVTLNNAKFIDDFKLFEGETIQVIRSGGVIPKVVGVNGHKIPFRHMYETDAEYKDTKQALIEIREMECQYKSFDMTCPSCNEDLTWNDNDVEIRCNNPKCPEMIFSKIVAFFNLMGVEELGEPTIQLFIDNGYDTIEKILSLSQNDMTKLERFGERKAEIVYSNIHSKMQDANLEKYMHASSCFKRLGNKQIKLILEHINDNMQLGLLTIDDLIKIKGIGKELAEDFINNYPLFLNFDEPIRHFITTKSDKKEEPKSNLLSEYNCVFTGVRDKELEQYIKDNGGQIGSGVSKKTTHLIMKKIGSGSSKEKKAIELGIEILTLEEFKEKLNLND